MARKGVKTNPHGANQYLADPRQNLFLSYYFDPKSKTFSNGLRSALRAGFKEEYAKVLVAQMPTWLSRKLKDLSMLQKAERNLDKMLDLETEQPVITMIGALKDATGKIIRRENPNLLRIKADVSKFIAERVGKERFGKEEERAGDTYNNTIIFTDERSRKIARRILAGNPKSEAISD